jgi:glycosyltransferase involved in cell wall biosynthesis/SAM-dependent methyltransferase
MAVIFRVMTPAEQKERNFKLSKTIIDYFGQTFFKGKKILDLGAGNGEFANIFARLGAEMTCVDARESNLNLIRKKFPYIKTMQLDLEKDFPFEPFSFDMAISIDLLCHLKTYEKHIESLLSVSERIVLETEILDSSNPNILVPIYESKDIDDHSFSGEGSIVSEKNLQNKLSSLNAKFKRVDETKLNHGQFRYDWSVNDTGRKFGNRRLWFIRRDRHHILKLESDAARRSGDVQYSERFINSRRPGLTIGKPLTLNDPTSISLPMKTALVNVPRAWSLDSKEKRFVIVIPSYNNERWCVKNILSALNQNYDKFRVIFVDDCSPDQTFNLVNAAVKNSPHQHKCTVIKNNSRQGALANLYNMIHSCADDEIVLTLDGDDWLPDGEVLNRLKRHYNESDIWMSYGQYTNHPNGGSGIAGAYRPEVIENLAFRKTPWAASHLRTFYAWLFKIIRKEDLSINGEFFKMTWDFAIMFPMMEMAKHHQKYISDILYVYNMENPINDHKVNVKMQQDLDRHIRNMPRYSPVSPPSKKTSVGLMLIATGKYDRFLQGIIDSADKHFLNENFDVTYYVFSDITSLDAERKTVHIPKSDRRIIHIPIQHKPFPFASMDRFAHFANNEHILNNEDYLYYVDVDCLFVDNIGPEIIGDLVGVQHCGFTNGKGPFETNPASRLFISDSYPKKYKNYFGGGFSGGRRDKYMELAKWCKDVIDRDVANNVIPVWHDETAINRYFLDNEPTVILTPSYHYPQSNIESYKKKWLPKTFAPKILLLDKNHHEIRQ